MPKKLYRSQTERMIAGICGGLAEYFDVDPVFMRLAFVLLAFLTGVGFLLYPLLWIIMPEQDSLDRPPREVVRENLGRMRENAERIRENAERLGDELLRATDRPTETGETTEEAATDGGEATRDSTGTTSGKPGREYGYAYSRPSGDRQFIAGVIVLLLGLILLLQNLNLFWWISFWRLWPLVLIVTGVFLLYRQSRARG